MHSDNRATLKVKISSLTREVRKRMKKIATLLSGPVAPDLVLNPLEELRHPHGSIPGNPLLAQSLYLTKYIERMVAAYQLED